MMRIFAFLQEPANYTLDLIDNVYELYGISHAFLKLNSAASNVTDKSNEEMTSCLIWRKIGRVWQVLKEYDAIIVNGYTGFDCLLIICLNIVFFKRPMALDSDTELRIPKNLLKRLIKWSWLHFLFKRRYCYGFAGGNYGHKDLFRHYGMAENRIFLMPMMVDNAKYSRVKYRQYDHCEPFRFGYMGRLVAHKQVDKIILAIGCLVNRKLPVELVVIGDGEERISLMEKSIGLPVQFTGALFGKEKIDALHSLDCLILYSASEPWGLVVNEALASGIPVIVSDKVGARYDLVEGHDMTGFVSNWSNVKDLSEKMYKMATDGVLRRMMRTNALKRMNVWNYDLYRRNLDAWITLLGVKK